MKGKQLTEITTVFYIFYSSSWSEIFIYYYSNLKKNHLKNDCLKYAM